MSFIEKLRNSYLIWKYTRKELPAYRGFGLPKRSSRKNFFYEKEQFEHYVIIAFVVFGVICWAFYESDFKHILDYIAVLISCVIGMFYFSNKDIRLSVGSDYLELNSKKILWTEIDECFMLQNKYGSTKKLVINYKNSSKETFIDLNHFPEDAKKICHYVRCYKEELFEDEHEFQDRRNRT